MPEIGHSTDTKMLHDVRSIAKQWFQLIDHEKKDGTLIANDMVKKNKNPVDRGYLIKFLEVYQ
jgi:hypothetical protein